MHQEYMKGPFDIIGDVHGCYLEMKLLLEKLNYIIYENDSEGKISVKNPAGRTVVFLGDIVDRGPEIEKVLKLVMGMVKEKKALCILGNHDFKLWKYLVGRNVKIAHGLEESVKQLQECSPDFKDEIRNFIKSLPSHYILDNGNLVVAHAGIKKHMIGKTGKEVLNFTLYGEVTGEKDEFGLPIRGDWASDYDGQAIIVYGHTPRSEVYMKNNTINIDTGCVFGNKLTALRYPEMEIISVNALKKYYDSPRKII